MKTKSKVNDLHALTVAAKRAGERAILMHRLAGIAVTGNYFNSSLIIAHRIDYQPVSPKAKYRKSKGLLAKVNERHNQKVLSELIEATNPMSIANNKVIVQSRSRGYQLTHTITAKAM